MIAPLSLLVAVLLTATPAQAQSTAADSLDSVINATRARSRAAARVFLDSTRTAAEREQASATVAAFLDSTDALAALRIAWNTREPERIRIIALREGAYIIDGHPDMESALLASVADRQAPPGFRSAAMNTLMAMLVGSRMRERRMPEIMRTLQAASTDQDSLIRRSAVAWLVISADSGTIDRLIRALNPGGDSQISPPEAVVFLGSTSNSKAKAAMRPLLVRSKDMVARTELIRVLGSDAASAKVIDRLVADSTEPDSVRAAALGAVFANRPHDFPNVAVPLISDEKAGDDVRVFAIDAVRLRSTAPAPSLRMAPSSRFDDLMRRLASESQSARVRAAAAAYVRDRGL